MRTKPTIYAMIPARIGSMRFKMKNLAMLNGKPMIAYAIEAAISSKVFDKVIVNSDSEVFQPIAENYGAEFYLRPEHLGGSFVKSDDVVKDFIEKYPSDIVVWENPIAPLQTVEDIRDTIELQNSGTIENSFHIPRGMLEFSIHPESAFFKNENLDPNKEIVLFCAAGGRSALAAKTLKDMGFQKVSHIDGGFSLMVNSGFKVK